MIVVAISSMLKDLVTLIVHLDLPIVQLATSYGNVYTYIDDTVK